MTVVKFIIGHNDHQYYVVVLVVIVSYDGLDNQHTSKVTFMDEGGGRIQVKRLVTYLDEVSAGH